MKNRIQIYVWLLIHAHFFLSYVFFWKRDMGVVPQEIRPCRVLEILWFLVFWFFCYMNKDVDMLLMSFYASPVTEHSGEYSPVVC